MTTPRRTLPAFGFVRGQWPELVRRRVWAWAALLFTAVVLGCGGGDSLDSPAITGQPTSMTVRAGERAVFTVAAAGNGPLAYQWYRDGIAIVGATSASLTLDAVSFTQDGEYTATVTNTVGETRSMAARLVVQSPFVPLPEHVTIRASAAMAVGGTATLDSNLPADTNGLQVEWELGDGTRSAERGPRHTYARQGTYEISLTVRNAAGESKRSTHTLWVGRYAEYNGTTCTGADRAGWCRTNRSVFPTFFLDEWQGFAFNEEGRLYLTSDGGTSWGQRPATGLEGIRFPFSTKLAFADALTGWVLGEDITRKIRLHPSLPADTYPAALMKTVDGGRSWHRQPFVDTSFYISGALLVGSPRDIALWGVSLPGGQFDQAFTSSDGGEGWSQSTLSRNLYRFSQVMEAASRGNARKPPFAPGSTAIWALDAQDSVVRSRNMGRSFEVVFRAPGGAKSVSFIDDRRGWVTASPVGADGVARPVIWQTSDGGNNWVVLETTGLPATVDALGLAALTFTDATTAWLDLSPSYRDDASAAAFKLLQFRSTDSGRSWVTVTFPPSVATYTGTPEILSANMAITAPYGYSGFEPSYVKKHLTTTYQHHFTKDGGRTWTPIDTGTGSLTALGGTRLLKRADQISVDAGGSWFGPFAERPIYGGLAGDSEDAAVVEQQERVFAASAAGPRHWLLESGAAPYTAPPNLPPLTTRTSSQSTRQTFDGGSTWPLLERAYGSVDSISARMQFLSTSVGWRLKHNRLDLTTDAAKTWSALPLPVPTGGFYALDSDDPEGTDMDFVSRSVGYVVHSTGSPSAGVLLKTTDGGASWASTPLPLRPQNVRFLNESIGVVVGYDGRIATTADGGATWVARNSGTGERLIRVQWVSPSVLVAIGAQASVLRSADGGVAWDRVASAGATGLKDIAFADDRRGWIAAASGTVLATTDGGASWVAQSVGSTEALVSVHRTDTGQARVFGRRGGIYLTETGGF